jgi:hypothetical protein
VDLLARPDNLVELSMAFAHELGHFFAMHEVLDIGGPQDDGDLSSLREVFEQRTDWGDANAGADEYDPSTFSRVASEDAIRSFD